MTGVRECHKAGLGRVRLGIRKNCFIVRVVKHWDKAS